MQSLRVGAGIQNRRMLINVNYLMRRVEHDDTFTTTQFISRRYSGEYCTMRRKHLKQRVSSREALNPLERNTKPEVLRSRAYRCAS